MHQIFNSLAIGDTISLSVSSHRHLKKIGLIDNEEMTEG